MPQDLVSFVLTPEQIAAAFDGVALIETSLPDRMSLPREDRAGMVFIVFGTVLPADSNPRRADLSGA